MKTQTLVLFGIVLGYLLIAGPLLRAEDSVATLVGNLKSTDESVRLRAIDELGARKQKAAEAVSPLTGLLKSKSANVRAHAAWSLGEIGTPAKAAVAALTELFKDPDQAVRRQAVNAVINIWPGPQIAVPLYVKLLEHSDPGVRIRIMNAIADAGPPAVPGLIDALKNERAAYWACLVLREMGPVAKDAVPALIDKLRDKNPAIRREAILALAAMEREATSAVGPVAAALDDEHTRAAATYALGRIGQIPADAEGRIRANAKSDDKVLSTASLWALARMHPEDKELRREVTEQLIARLKDKDSLVRVAAAHALTALPPAPEITGPIWEKAIQDADETTIRHALGAFVTLGAPAVPRLVNALKHEKVRGHVIYALGEIGPAAAPATPSLTKLVNDDDDRIAHEAVIALAKIGPGAKEAVPELVKVLAASDESAIPAAAYALGSIGPDAAAAIPALRGLLKGNDVLSAQASAWALTQIQPGSAEIAAEVVPVLIQVLSSALPFARRGAAEALGELGPLAQSARAALQKAATSDEDLSVRVAAANALKPISGTGVSSKSGVRRRR
jgi:HEAT repeat protein